MKKKVFIMAHAMEIGGAERALIEMLNCFDYDNYDVDLFLLRHCGDWLCEIPKQVNLLPEIKQYTALFCPMVTAVKTLQFGVAIGRIIGKYKAKSYNKKHFDGESCVAIDYSHKYPKTFLPKINSSIDYDLAISFLTPHYIVAEKVNAKKKIAWIHTDYSEIGIDIESERKVWSRFDYIASISEDCTKGFLSKFPKLENKIIPIGNLLSTQTVYSKAEEDFTNEYDHSTDIQILLTIGRFSYAKRLDEVPRICKILKDNGVNFKWYIIGYGSEEDLIKSKIAEYGVKNELIILGKRNNPYPYIKNCDVYVQPSRYEGKSVTVREAQMLGKPVIITNYPTAHTQLNNRFDGIIVSYDTVECANDMAKVLLDEELLQTVAENTKKIDYTNKSELKKLYALMN